MTSVLVDGDIYLYKAASEAEKEVQWPSGIFTWHSDPGEAQAAFATLMDGIDDELNASEIVLCLSDRRGGNFRKDLDPTYKSNRKAVRKPLGYWSLYDWAAVNWKTVQKPKLEADDVLGIIATRAPGRYVIVSADKDLKTIPGHLYRKNETVEIGEDEANYWHLYQTLIGDTTDGYPGCPGVGPVKATALLEKSWGLREGGVTYFDAQHAWRNVVGAYSKAGLDEAAAIHQARLARILRSSDWDFATSTVKLWEPPSVA